MNKSKSHTQPSPAQAHNKTARVQLKNENADGKFEIINEEQ
jgi:hypothetical protein